MSCLEASKTTLGTLPEHQGTWLTLTLRDAGHIGDRQVRGCASK